MLRKPSRKEEDEIYEGWPPGLREIAREYSVWHVIQAIHMLEGSKDPEKITNLLEANRKLVQEQEQEKHDGLGERVIKNFKSKL